METNTSLSKIVVQKGDEQNNTNVEMQMYSQSSAQQLASQSMMAAANFEKMQTSEDSFHAGPSDPHHDDVNDNDDGAIDEADDDYDDGEIDDDVILETSLNDSAISIDFDQQSNNKSHHDPSDTTSLLSATPQGSVQKSLMTLAADGLSPSKSSTRSPDRFQIELSNLPTGLNNKQFHKFLESTLKFKPIRAKLFSKARIALVAFRNENQKQIALATFDKKKWKKKRMKARGANALQEPASKAYRSMQKQEALDMARKKFIQAMAIDVDVAQTDKQPISDEDAVQMNAERLNFSITPLWNIPYSEQLKIKQNIIVDTLQRLTDLLLQIPELKNNSWLSREIREGCGGLCCELAECVPSPVINGYRNNCDYSVAEGINNEKTVGFKLGFHKEEFSGVVEPTQCVHISEEAKKIARYFQSYVRQSNFEVFNLKTLKSGYWQHLSVRTTEYGEKMAIVQLHPQHLSMAQLDDLYQDITRFFTEGEGTECNLTSLYVIANSSKSTSIVTPSKKAPITLLYGSPVIHEVINGVKLRISPKSYFQVNTKGAEKMVDIMREWMGDCANSLLLDICCGSGTIGLCLAKYVSKVIGIDSQPNLISDAEKNATLNGIQNAVFIGGKVEDILTNQVFKHLPQRMPIIGIADPPRSGLQSKVIEGLRKCEGMDKLIFVACNTNTAYTNFADLCRPSPPDKKKTKPFRLVKAVPVDFFPHSHHCALLLFFERDNTPSDTYKYFKFFY